MAKPINMPQVGQDLETAVITEWCVNENDSVKRGDIIAVVESDKAAFEVEVFESGTVLKLLFKEGDEAKVFEPIAYIGKPGEVFEDIEAIVSVAEGDSNYKPDIETREEEHDPNHKKILSSPVAKRMAKENGINLSAVTGSGPNGRIIKEDILKVIEERSSLEQVTAASKTNKKATAENSDQILPFSKMRKQIAGRLVISKQKIPHFYLSLDVDVTDLLLWRQAQNSKVPSDNKITVNDILIMGVAKALRKNPQINTHVETTHLTIKDDINIGVAVSIDDGLIVPVIEKADKKDIYEISKASREMVRGARKGLLKPQVQGTFTLSNLGMHSIDKFIPIINPPECAILGVGKAVKKVVPLSSNSIGVRDILTLTLSCDHRAVDGTLAAQFLEDIKTFLEEIKMSVDK